MHSFHYSNGSLHCEGISIADLANQYGTPLYVYSSETFRDRYTRLDGAFSSINHEVAYAVKANSNLSILSLLAKMGSGFDIVSGGELFRVIKAGGDPGKCTFAGVGKTREEIEYALQQGIYSINVESEEEAFFINQVASELNLVAPIAFRVNPNVDAKTHKYISTGKSENKFGIDFEFILDAYERASSLPHLKLKGLQMHIGSQLTSVSPFVEAVEKVTPLAADLKNKYDIEFFSIGGGIGIVYEEALASGSESWWTKQPDETRPLTPEQYSSAIIPSLAPLGLKILLEPGRFIAGNAGVLVTKCLYEKKGSTKTFKIVDSGMHHLIRPALYEGFHEIVPVAEPKGAVESVDVVGPICESGDFFCQNREVPTFAPGEFIALMSAGAYGMVMATTYNSHPLPAEILVDRNQARIARKRQTFQDLVEGEEG
ncbi:MAG: diaminopimelate decarboxylase [Verrucomicrobia bacterium]|jgi:diaminopimelate decarboxylase|nr:diaminopimelate decarboxylase [Verrucomicrobiota bacterium]MDA7507260.1 diaminopimelate decarboxylase [Akkermansiaceae bacterium]MDB4608422.1 diaminopimelate decarboxylase [bacterium]MBT6167962.1 diaminopimelate decarboxylase [Verrucomicrobiota bacterium]MBT7215052.1 diaminopimelate decarboxylase [Verrucomicrobiota bacterium]